MVGFERRRVFSGSRRRRGTTYRDHPVVRYTTQTGQPVQFESPLGTSPRLHREGQQVPVLYNPADPTDARIATGCMRYGLAIFFIVLGLGMALFSALFALVSWLILAQVPTT